MPPPTFFHLFLLSEQLHRQPRAVYKYWAPCRACLSLRPLVPDFTCSLFPWFDSGYNLRQSTLASVGTETGTHSAYCACFERFHRCSSWTRCACTSLCHDRCPLSSGHPCCSADAVPHGPFVMLLVQFSDKVVDVVHSPFEWLDHRCPATVVISCSSSAGCPAAEVYASRCRVVVDFSLLMVLTILFGTV